MFRLLLCLTLMACGTPRRGLPVAPPVALDAEGHRGQLSFARYCHSCHPHGEGGLGLTLNNRPLPEFLIRFQVRSGLGAMPAFSREELPPETLDDIVAYLKQVRASPATPLPPPPAPSPAVAGS